MSEEQTVVHRFYDAFAQRDGEAMAACYAPDASFSDPVFPKLEGVEVGSMWRMLCEAGKDLKVEASDIVVDGARGTARWDAWYTFSATGRKVHNIVHAEMELKDDLIAKHVDRFGFWRWTRHALGAPGVLLGWSPMVQGKVRAQADKGLRLWMKRKRVS
jgi:ketosteroid isomerase-like protein